MIIENPNQKSKTGDVVEHSITAPVIVPIVQVEPNAPVGSSLAAVAAAQPDKFNMLLELLIEDRARALEAGRAQKAKEDARRAQYARNTRESDKAVLKVQARCSHQKGGKTRKRNATDDFNVYAHVFITGETYIKCNGCGMKWRPTDTVKYVHRNGKVYENHTKKGWAEAMEMVFKSTNQRSSSEIPPEMIGNIVKDFAPRSAEDEIGVNLEPVGEAEETTV